MKRFLFALSILAAVATAVRAQGTYYEQWIDDNRGGLVRGTLAEGEQTVVMDASGIPTAGLHFLNIIPYDESGEPGVWRRIAFMMPEGWPATTDAVTMEYWVTAYDKAPTRMAYTSSEVAFSIDVSNMSYGLHFLNFRTFNSAGEAGPWKQMTFYISNGIFDAEEIEYEYWVDDGEPQTGTGYMPGVIPLQIDPSGLANGEHTFNFKAKNGSGMYGEVFTTTFQLPMAITGDVNGDGSVTIADVTALVNIILGKDNGESHQYNHGAADVNTDEAITIADVTALVNIILGK